MTINIYIPRDAGALALGAEKVAAAAREEIEKRGLDAEDRPQRLARHVLA